jgi:hypothetical protein
LRNHYETAVDSIDVLTIELGVVKKQLGMTEDDFRQDLADEKTYLHSLTEPPVETKMKLQYIRALNELFQCR